MDENKWIGVNQVTLHKLRRQGSRMIWMRPDGDLHMGDPVNFDESYKCRKSESKYLSMGTVLSEPGSLNLIIVEVKGLPRV